MRLELIFLVCLPLLMGLAISHEQNDKESHLQRDEITSLKSKTAKTKNNKRPPAVAESTKTAVVRPGKEKLVATDQLEESIGKYLKEAFGIMNMWIDQWESNEQKLKIAKRKTSKTGLLDGSAADNKRRTDIYNDLGSWRTAFSFENVVRNETDDVKKQTRRRLINSFHGVFVPNAVVGKSVASSVQKLSTSDNVTATVRQEVDEETSTAGEKQTMISSVATERQINEPAMEREEKRVSEPLKVGKPLTAEQPSTVAEEDAESESSSSPSTMLLRTEQPTAAEYDDLPSGRVRKSENPLNEQMSRTIQRREPISESRYRDLTAPVGRQLAIREACIRRRVIKDDENYAYNRMTPREKFHLLHENILKRKMLDQKKDDMLQVSFPSIDMTLQVRGAGTLNIVIDVPAENKAKKVYRLISEMKNSNRKLQSIPDTNEDPVQQAAHRPALFETTDFKRFESDVFKIMKSESVLLFLFGLIALALLVLMFVPPRPKYLPFSLRTDYLVEFFGKIQWYLDENRFQTRMTVTSDEAIVYIEERKKNFTSFHPELAKRKIEKWGHYKVTLNIGNYDNRETKDLVRLTWNIIQYLHYKIF